MATKNGVAVRTDKPIPERYISMSNALARSAQGLKLSEKRIVALALAKTDSVSARDALNAQLKNGWTVKISVDEYKETYCVDADTAYSQIKSGAMDLFKRSVKTMTVTTKGLKEIHTNWCGQCIYHHGEGWAEIAFTPQIAPHLLGLRSKFVSYKLKQASALRSIYAWRLFECLQSWGNKGVWAVEIDKFNHAMESPLSCQKDFGNLRLRVIEPALKELRAKDNMLIDLEIQKAGRKVTGLVFKFKQNEQRQLEF